VKIRGVSIRRDNKTFTGETVYMQFISALLAVLDKNERK